MDECASESRWREEGWGRGRENEKQNSARAGEEA